MARRRPTCGRGLNILALPGSWDQVWSRLVAVAAMLFAAAVQAAEPAAEDADFFEKKIRPVLIEHCYECHSAQSEKLKGKLLLDNRDASRKGGESGPAVVPGNPDASLL